MVIRLPNALNHGFSRRGSRRATLRAAGGGLAALLAGSRLPSVQAAPPPPPAASLEEWPVCSDERPDYCIFRFEVDGEDRLANPSPESRPRVYGTSSTSNGTTVERVEWFVNDGEGQRVTEAMRDKPITLGIRTGQIKVGGGFAFAGPTFPETTGSAEAGWEFTVHTEVDLQQVYFTDPEVADDAWLVCSGMSFNTLHSTYPHGQFASSNALSMGPPQWANGGWQVNLFAPHFSSAGSTPDGLTHAHYTGWLSAAGLAEMGLTLTQAQAGGLATTRIEDGVAVPLEAQLSERAGGLLLHIPDVTFSSPTIRMAPVGSGGGGGGNGPDKKKRKKKKKKKKR